MTTGTCECGQPLIGVEITGRYDGVLFWNCSAGHMTHRFPRGHWVRARADAFAAEYGMPMREVPNDTTAHD